MADQYTKFIKDKTYFIKLEVINEGCQGWGASDISVYIRESDGQPYLASVYGTGQPAGQSTLAPERMAISGTPRKITYEELVSLAEKAYPGIAQEYEGINETNWQDYQNVYSDYRVNAQSEKTKQCSIQDYRSFQDYFVDYCELDGLRIVQLADLDIFFAIRNSGGIADTIVAHYLQREERIALKSNTLKAQDLYKSQFSWGPLCEYEERYTPDFLAELFEYNKREQTNPIEIVGRNIYFSSKLYSQLPDKIAGIPVLEKRAIIPLTIKEPFVCFFEDGVLTRKYCLQTEGDEDFTGKFFHTSIRIGPFGQPVTSAVMIDGFVADTDAVCEMGDEHIGYRMEVHFLDCGEPASSQLRQIVSGQELTPKGLKYPGKTIPTNVRLIGFCTECYQSFAFHGHPFYMTDRDVAYSDDGLDCLVMEAHQTYDIDKETWTYEADGKVFRYYNSFNCPHCKTPYIDYKKHPENKKLGVSGCVHLGRKAFNFKSSSQESQKKVPSEPKRLRDLFIDYCQLDDLRIVRLLNYDLFWAIQNEHILLLSHQHSALKRNKLTAGAVYAERFGWRSLYETEQDYNSDVAKLIKQAGEYGFTRVCPNCQAYVGGKEAYCSQCGTTVEAPDESAYKNYTFEQLREACIKDAEMLRMKAKQQTVELPRLGDLFVDYFELPGIRIVRVLNTDEYFAIRDTGAVTDTTLVLKLYDSILDELKKGTLTSHQLIYNASTFGFFPELRHDWKILKQMESDYAAPRVESWIKEARKNAGFPLVCSHCEKKLEEEAKFCPHCGTPVRSKCTFQQLHDMSEQQMEVYRASMKKSLPLPNTVPEETDHAQQIKASELLMDCFGIEDLRIVRALNLEYAYFVIWDCGTTASTTLIAELSAEGLQSLQDNRLSAEKLKTTFPWQALDQFDACYVEKAEEWRADAELKAGWKPSELLVDYCELDELRILRPVDNDFFFFAVQKTDAIADNTLMYELSIDEKDQLRAGTLTDRSILENRSEWRPLVGKGATLHEVYWIQKVARRAKNMGYELGKPCWQQTLKEDSEDSAAKPVPAEPAPAKENVPNPPRTRA